MSLRRAIEARPRSERGVTSLGIAAFAGAFVLAGSLIAGVFVEGGLAGSEALDLTFGRALTSVSTGVQVNGPVIARTDGARATIVLVDVTTTAGGGAVALSPAPAPDAGNGDAPALRVRYISSDVAPVEVPFAVTWLSGDADALLEPGEVAELALDVSAIDPPLAANGAFTLELRPGDGVVATLARTMPPGRPLDLVVNLW